MVSRRGAVCLFLAHSGAAIRVCMGTVRLRVTTSIYLLGGIGHRLPARTADWQENGISGKRALGGPRRASMEGNPTFRPLARIEFPRWIRWMLTCAVGSAGQTNRLHRLEFHLNGYWHCDLHGFPIPVCRFENPLTYRLDGLLIKSQSKTLDNCNVVRGNRTVSSVSQFRLCEQF